MARVESVQYKAALVVSVAWKGTSKDRLYQDLGWESLYTDVASDDFVFFMTS